MTDICQFEKVKYVLISDTPGGLLLFRKNVPMLGRIGSYFANYPNFGRATPRGDTLQYLQISVKLYFEWIVKLNSI